MMKLDGRVIACGLWRRQSQERHLGLNTSMSLVGLLGVIGTTFVSLWAAFRYVLLGNYRLSGDTSKRLIDKIKKDAAWSWVLSGEYVEPPRYPSVFEAFVFMNSMPFFFARNERLMTAGWKGKEEFSSITYLRWQRSAIEALLREGCADNSIPISALAVGSADRLGALAPDPSVVPYLNRGSYEDMEEEVRMVVDGKVKKTGLLLHGAPGNGKTQFVKYISKKYKIPIYVVYLRPDYDNYDIARMFSEIPRHCVVLLEDFDNYFNGRECSMKNDQVRFTFDSIINALDGVHNDYSGVVFVMTANDVGKIDDSLKNRPSRFKFVREFKQPDLELRNRILGDPKLSVELEGASLDTVFSRLGSSPHVQRAKENRERDE